MQAARSNRRAIRIVSQCATAEEFVTAFHPYLERDSLFIATGSPEEPGQAVRFVLTLAGGETVLRGAGRVVETHRDRGNFYGLRGMKLQFDELDDGSRRALAALESRAVGPKARPAAGAGATAPDVIECLIYDDPETQAVDPAAAGGGPRRSRPRVEHGLPLGDDDVTAVSQAPRPPREAGTGPRPAVRATQSGPAHPSGPATGMSFVVPRPPTDPDGPPEGMVAPPPDPPSVMSGSIELADRPTDSMNALRRVGPPPSPGPPSPPPPPSSPPPPMPAVRMAHTPAVGLPSVGVNVHVPPSHMMPPPEPVGFPAEFTMPATRPGARRGIPRPPMPAERTEIVRIPRPSYVRTAAVSATLGALLGLGAGYLLWGLDHVAPRGAGQTAPAEPKPVRATDERPAVPAATLDAPADAGPEDDQDQAAAKPADKRPP